MIWIPRLMEALLQKEAATRPAIVLTGARQTGKTSLVRRLFPEHHYVSLDLPSEAAQAEADPKAFLARHAAPLLVDEVQYAPTLLRHLKTEVDRHRLRYGQFILTGSQPFELMQGVSETLAGRAAILKLGGLSYAEISTVYPNLSVEQFVLRGGYPELHQNPKIESASFYRSYIATYLERDLRSQLQVGSLRDFERFLRACALRTSQVLNRAELARDVGIAPSTAAQWLSVLERSGIIALLEPWFSNRTKSIVKSPKLHFLDSGLCAYLMGLRQESDLYRSPLIGALWESTVFSELRRLLDLTDRWQLHYWRDRTKEADFLLHQAGRFQLIDAKWSESPTHLGSLPKIRKEFPEKTAISLLCRTRNRHPLAEDIEALSLPDIPSIIAR